MATRSDPQGSRPLVGRDRELALLDLLVDGLARGENGAVCFIGEPGIGKSALIAEVLRRAAESGYGTAVARAAEFESDVPFAVLVEALEPHVRALAERNAIAPSDAALLSALFPSLAAEPAIAGSGAAPIDEAYRLRHCLRMLVERLAAERPLVLALDDLQWADPASVSFVCGVLHRGLEGPLLLVLAARGAQAESRLLRALEDAERHGSTRSLVLA